MLIFTQKLPPTLKKIASIDSPTIFEAQANNAVVFDTLYDLFFKLNFPGCNFSKASQLF